MKRVSNQRVKEILNDGEELALLDVREQGLFGKEHLLPACSIPLSRMELMLADLVPRRSTRVVLVDEGPSEPPGLGERAAARLSVLGYSDVAVMEGGIEGWRQAGFELFTGVNVPSKAFGEFVEITYDTPRIPAETLKAKMDAGEDFVILDARTTAEYNRMCIPGGISVPGAELVYRVHDLAPDPKTLVVVNCAGRTRSIIGAQSLINAGISNPVAALKNGTMGWHLSDLELAYGKDRKAPEPSSEGLARARACAQRVADRYGVRMIDHQALTAWQQGADERTLYILDVRSPEEFEAGHLKGSRNAPGGQLVQATDEYVAVQKPRIVLVDDTEVRAIMTASWLIQMGWAHVSVLSGGILNLPLARGPHMPEVLGFTRAETILPGELVKRLHASPDPVLIDLASSVEFRHQHIPGAHWGIRSRLEEDLQKIASREHVILTSPDGVLAHLTAREVKEFPDVVSVKVLEGGTHTWMEAGLPTTKGMERPISEVNDLYYKPFEHMDAPEEDMRGYLDWEVGLVEQIERDGSAKFRAFPR